jgi:hypothetical protein
MQCKVGTPRSGTRGAGERRLLIAMLADAIRRRGGDRTTVGARAAAEWMCDAPVARRYSFERACLAADVDPARLRRRLGLRRRVPRQVSRVGFARRPA